MKTGNRANGGVLYAIGSYALWGLFPIYWKLLHRVPAPQLVSHRILWSFFWLAAVVLFTGQGKALQKATLRWRVLPIYLSAAMLIGANWLVYVWAVNAGFIVETSLGYFINPLLSVLIGVIFLRERLRTWQWLPVVMVGIGVLYLTYTHGSPPWIALFLASTWAVYGLLKKLAPLGSLHGLTLETGILFFPVLAYLVYSHASGQGAFLRGSLLSDALLIGGGVVTTVPLFLFATAVHRIPLSLIGILQYIAPTIQFLLGVLVYKEPFSSAQSVGFGLVWAALVIFALESYLARRERAKGLIHLPRSHS